MNVLHKSAFCFYFVELDLDMFLLTNFHVIKVLMNDNGTFFSWLIGIVKIKCLNMPHLSVGICILGFKGHFRVGWIY